MAEIVPPINRVAAVALLAAALALVAAGCGGGSSSQTSAPSSGGGRSSPPAPSRSSGTPEHSIQAYGSAAPSALKASIATSAFSFFRAMAASDFARVCAGLSASNRAQLEAFARAQHEKLGCPALLKALISSRGTPEARAAAAGRLISVRVKGANAFVIFKPRGGMPSYFAMKREGGAWKAISMVPAVPLDPAAAAGR